MIYLVGLILCYVIFLIIVNLCRAGKESEKALEDKLRKEAEEEDELSKLQ